MRFNTAYLCKKERPCSHYADLLFLQENGIKVTKVYKPIELQNQSMKDSFVEDFLSANYFSFFTITDGSTDASILEQEIKRVNQLSFSASKHQIMPMQKD